MAADRAAVKVLSVSKNSSVSKISRFGALVGTNGAANVEKSWLPKTKKQTKTPELASDVRLVPV
jgi:hypothetical protein